MILFTSKMKMHSRWTAHSCYVNQLCMKTSVQAAQHDTVWQNNKNHLNYTISSVASCGYVGHTVIIESEWDNQTSYQEIDCSDKGKHHLSLLYADGNPPVLNNIAWPNADILLRFLTSWMLVKRAMNISPHSFQPPLLFRILKTHCSSFEDSHSL